MDWREQNETVVEILGELRSGANNWHRAHCPFCVGVLGSDDKRFSFGMRIHTGNYHCFRCGTSGRLREAPEHFGVTGTAEPEELPPPSSIKPPTNCDALFCEPGASAVTYDHARSYLLRRNFTEKHWERGQFFACLNGEYTGPTKTQRVRSRIIMPIFSVDDEKTWVGWVGRDWTNHAIRKYLYPEGMQRGQILYNHALLDVETDEPVLVMEGILDTVRYDAAVGCLGKPSRWQTVALKRSKRPVAVCLDGDAWEEGAHLSRVLRLEGLRAGYVKLPPKRDPGDVDPDWLEAEARKCLDLLG